MNEDVAGTLQAEDLFDLFYGIKSAYALRAVWMLNRSTLPLIRAFETSAGGYIWSPGIAAGDPPNILGRPYLEATDVQAPLAAGTYGLAEKPIAFGDFRRAYTIADRVAVQVQRDPYTLAASGQVRFIARKRVGGKPMIQEAAAYLLSAAT
jgi:HK97 family phage major capsid protein